MIALHSLIATFFSGGPALRPDPEPVFPAPTRDAAPGQGRGLDRPMRVLMITEASGGGSGRHVLDLAEGLLARGCDVHLIYSPRQADRFFRAHLNRIDSVKRAACPLHKQIHPDDLTALRRIRRYIRDFGPFDVIHGHSAKGGALARLAGLATATPVFYTPHGLVLMDPGVPLRKRLLYHAIEWALGGVTRRIITVSPEEHRLAVRKGIGRSRIVLIPNGVAPIAFPPRTMVRRGLGLADDTLAIGFIGRLVDQKAPDVLVKAFAIVARETPRVRLIMVGSGPLEDSLRHLADRLGIGDRILWLGEHEGTAVLPGLDLFAIASRKEGLPYVLLEAMAAGLPILATATSGVELLVEHGRNGFIVPPNCPDAFAAALGELTADPRRRARFGRASLERAAQFTTEAMVDRTIASYRLSLPGSGSAPSAAAPRGLDDARAPLPADDSADPRGPAVVSLGRSRLTRASPEHSFNHPSTEGFQGVSIMASKPRSSEMHPGPGFRVKLDVVRPDPDLMDEFRNHATPDISDLLNRLYAVDPAIRCLTGDHHLLCGPACTVKVFPGDNLMVHKALDVAQPGDIVVVDAGGSTQNAVLGDLISTKARHRGIAGFIVDGLVRDLPSILPLDFPVFARGTTPIGPLHRGPGEINYPICCGGIVVSPGDLIVADAAGIIVIPREIAPELLERLNLHDESNRAYLESVRKGDFSNRWVDQVLEQHRCPIGESPGPDPGATATNGAGSRNGSRPTNGRAAALVDEEFDAVTP